MILHFVTDDKFTDYAIRQFSSPEMYSEFVLIPSNFNREDSNVKLIEHCIIIKNGSSEFKALLDNLGAYQAVFLHGLFWPWTEDILRAVPDNVKVVWYFWGGEIYSRKDLFQSFLAPLTRLAYKCHRLKKYNSIKNDWELPKNLFCRIDCCLTSIYEEYAFAREYLNNKSLKHLWYTYYSIENTVGDLMNEQSIGNDVLFCNSAAIENNMFDAILLLSGINNRKYLGDRKIYMPMGYGSPWIARAMIKLGKLLLGNKFCPILEFLPREKYNWIMAQCSTLILPYWSPAGQGNIITGLWLGMRVYLSEKSIAYAYFKRMGTYVFSLEKDFSKYHYSRLNNVEIETNRSVMRKWYSKEHVQQSAKNVVSALIKSQI